MEPRLKDSLNKGHHITTSLQRKHSKKPKIEFPIVLIHFSPPNSGQLPYSGQLAGPDVSFIERFHRITLPWFSLGSVVCWQHLVTPPVHMTR